MRRVGSTVQQPSRRSQFRGSEDYVQLGEVEHAAEMAARMAILAGRTNSARADTRLRCRTEAAGVEDDGADALDSFYFLFAILA
jgi:hypothetical protein